MDDPDQTISVQRLDGENNSEELNWPQEYGDFMKDIAEKFNINTKNEIIKLQVITQDDDDKNINSQVDFDNYTKENDIKEFRFITEKTNDDFGGVSEEDLKKLLEENIIDDVKVDIDINNVIKDIIDNEEYEQKLKKDEINYTNIFKQNLEKSVNDMIEKKFTAIKEEINTTISKYSELSLSAQKEAYNSICTMKDNLTEIKEQTEDMTNAINQLHASIANNQLILSSVENLNKMKIQELQKKKSFEDNNKNKNDLEMSGIKNNNKNNNNFLNANPLMEEEEEKISIEIENKNIQKSMGIQNSNSFIVDNIILKNVGDNSYENLVLYKDDDNSSDEIHFSGNDKYGIFELPGELGSKEKRTYKIKLQIDEAKPNQKYHMTLYVREKNNDKNLSEEFKIIVEVNQAEDPNQKKKERAMEIYEELKNEFKENIGLIKENEIIEKLMNNNLNKGEIENDLKDKIAKIKEKENNQKVEDVYSQLNLYNLNIERQEVLDKIKEEQLNKENVQNWIDGKNAEKIFDEIKQLDDVDISKVTEEEVKKNIIAFNFDIDKIKQSYPKQEEPEQEQKQDKDNEEKPKQNQGGEEEKVQELFQELEDSYGIVGFMDEEAAKNKIRELNCDKDALIDWIENSLLNGE